ncbi:uncharacterized protein [Diadema antillarum]|uniref:uncharacterized protein n=1 Tax=Diadema antillarum TaxID=105358 RepID=UPI003A85BB63
MATSSQSNDDSDRGRLQIDHVDTSTNLIPDTRDRVTSEDTGIDPYAVGRSVPQVPGNEFGNVTTSPDYARHIFQNTSQSHGYETEASRERDATSSADTSSRPFYDVIHQDDKGVSEKAANETEPYMDMSGSVKKPMSITFAQSRDASTDEEDTDEHGYMLFNVNLPEVTSCQPQTSRATMKAFDSDDVPSYDNPNSVELSSRLGAATGDASTSGNLQSSIYQEIPCTVDQSPSIPEAQYHQRDIDDFTVNCSGNPLQQEILCDENCLANDDSWVFQAPRERRIFSEIKSVNHSLIGFEYLDELSNKSYLTVFIEDAKTSSILSLTHQMKLRIKYTLNNIPVKFITIVKCYEELLTGSVDSSAFQRYSTTGMRLCLVLLQGTGLGS